MSDKKLHSYTNSHVGLVRTKNDDSSYVGDYLAIVADGMGGHAGGDTASTATVLELVHLDHPYHDENQEGVENLLVDDIHTANSLLSDLANEDTSLTGMGTTATALLLTGENLQFAHIGDSRAYRLKDDIFEKISTDHTYVQKLVEEGELSPEEAANHPNKNVVTRVLGDVTASPEIDTDTFKASVGERWLLASDGLTDVVPEEVIEQTLRKEKDLKKIVEKLTDLTLDGGSPDNVTIVVADVTDKDTPSYNEKTRISDAIAQYSNVDLQPQEILDQFSENVSTAGFMPLNALSTLYSYNELEARDHILAGAAQNSLSEGKTPATIPLVERLEGKQKELNKLKNSGKDTTSTGPITQTSPKVKEKKKPQNIVKKVLWVLLPLLVIALIGGSLYAVYSWTQDQYYVGTDNKKVVIYKGIPQNAGPLELNHVQTVTNVELSDLPEYAQREVRNTISADSYQKAENTVSDLPRVSEDSSKKKPSAKSSSSKAGSKSNTKSSRNSTSSESSHSSNSSSGGGDN